MSTNIELEATYDPSQVEGSILALWDSRAAFRAAPDERPADQRFVVMIPLPNVTGTLHLGHAINNTLQDIVTRWHRMAGFNSLYQPGTDHAGIATQAVVERRILEEEGKSRHDLGRDELVRRIWEWKAAYEKRILSQLKMMGCSCDWERVRFTLDEGYSKAVQAMFFKLFCDGLIYRGKRLVNWDTHLQTAVADDEVYHETMPGHFWHFKYPLDDPPAGGPTHLGFATTRPETMLGDTALAVNPSDDRYRSLVGKAALIPLFDPPRRIPIIADEWADPEKGTGCVKITPAHDANDYQVGVRHDLPMINIMTPEGRVSENGGKYAGQTFTEARKRIVADMEEMGLLVKTEDMPVDLPHSDRSKSPIEPYLSDQWFVRMGDVEGGVKLGDGSRAPGLAQAAMDAVQYGRVEVFPGRYAKTYVDWLSEKRDWCISRQLWWGHRIPIWAKRMPDADAVKRASAEVESALAGDVPCSIQPGDANEEGHELSVCLLSDESGAIDKLESLGFTRDPDVLDTWFSSQLWPFATLGWPEKTPDVDYYYPGTVLITSRDIITLWVARMVLSGLYNLGEVPFRHVYIHPKILDGRGETMSKSKGNGVDPLDIIEMYGADAMRYSLADMTTETQDVRLPVEYRCPHCGTLTQQTAKNMQAKTIDCKGCKKQFATRWADEETVSTYGLAQIVSEKFEIGRNFCNKLWNAARFSFMNLDQTPYNALEIATLPTEDRWILACLGETIRETHEALGRYRYSMSIKLLRDFFWDSLCDWYIELTKARMSVGPKGPEAQQVLAFCLDQTLRLLHPFVPFITERLWGQLNVIVPQRGLPGLAEPAPSEMLITAELPPKDGWTKLTDRRIVHVFEDLQAATRGIRDLRNKYKISPKDRVVVTVNAPADDVAALTENASIVQRLANVSDLRVDSKATRPKNAAIAVLGALQLFVHDISDDAAERARLEKDMAATAKQITGKSAKLDNEKFVRNARAEVVQAERERLAALEAQREMLAQSLALLD